MKQITFFIQNMSGGGAERVVANLCQEFIERGVTVNLICIEKKEQYQLPNQVNRFYLLNRTLIFARYSKYFLLPLLAYKLCKIVKNNNIAIVNSHMFFANYVNILAKKLFKIPAKTIATSATSLNRYFSNNLFGKLNLYLIRLFYPLADLHIFKSKQMSVEYQQFCTIKNSTQIYNPVVVIESKNNSKKNNNTKFNIVSMGRLIEVKRYVDLINAMSKLDKNCQLHILGEGPLLVQLQQLTASKGLQNYVNFYGFVKDPHNLIKSADCYVSCSSIEGFPNHIIEAMACNLPVIAADCRTGPREILAPASDFSKILKANDSIEITDYGILYPVADIANLIISIKYIINNQQQARQMVANSLVRIGEFNITTIADQYQKVIAY